jgi:hypothetical protein
MRHVPFIAFIFLLLGNPDLVGQDKADSSPKAKKVSVAGRSSNLRDIKLADNIVLADDVLVSDLIRIILDPTDVDTLSVKTGLSDGDAIASFGLVNEVIDGKSAIVGYYVAEKVGSATVYLDYSKGGVPQHRLVKFMVKLTGLGKVIDVVALPPGSSGLIKGAQVGDILRVKMDSPDADTYVITSNDVVRLESRLKIAGISYAIFACQKAGSLSIVISNGSAGWIAGGAVTP